MQNKMDAVLSDEDRDRALNHLRQARDLLPFLIDMTPDERQTTFKMGEKGRPFVEGSLAIVEQDDSFMPRSFDRVEMRQDNELYENLLPIYMFLVPFFEAVNDTMMLVGSDLIMAGLDVYRNAKDNGKGENLDDLVPLLGRRFKRNPGGKNEEEDGDDGGENP